MNKTAIYEIDWIVFDNESYIHDWKWEKRGIVGVDLHGSAGPE